MIVDCKELKKSKFVRICTNVSYFYDRARPFLSCLQYSLTNTVYENIILKPKQVTCFESVFLNRDTLAILPTRYGKSATFHLLPKLLQRRNVIEKHSCNHPIVIVISPLNSLMNDQLSVLNASGITAAILRANVIQHESLYPLMKVYIPI